jgi:Tol biopolymer transport system component
MHEIPLTNGKHGHTLNATQIFSPDGKWLVFDTRNDDTHISRTGSICKLNITTKEIIEIYKTKNQSMHGPGVGAAAWNPVNDQIIFIHGLLNCNEEKPYGFTRRFGAIISGNHEAGENAEIGVRQQCYHAEGRNIQEPFTKGALRGGTHAHTWSADGKWISFTYNDYLMECLEKTSSSERKDLRTIGVMTMVENIHEDHEAGENAEIGVRSINLKGTVAERASSRLRRTNDRSVLKVHEDHEDDENAEIGVRQQCPAENFRGTYFAVVAAEITENPKFGSDEIERAFDECWLGKNGYTKDNSTVQNGSQQTRAIAFQGNVRSADGTLVTEVFIADIPSDITQSLADKLLEGTLSTRPNVPAGLIQRRVTFTTERKHPGLQGPRFRLRSSADGSLIYFLMKDDNGIVQIYSVSSAENTKNTIVKQPLKQITNFKYSIQSQFNLSPDDKYISVVSNNQIYLVSTQDETTAQRAASWSQDGSMTSIGEKYNEREAPINGIHWSPDGKSLIYNRYVFIEDDYYIQIFQRLIPSV